MKSIAWKYGLFMAAGFIGLFLIMYFLNLAQHYNLRVLNSIILLGLLYGSIQAYRYYDPEKVGNYVSGVAMGMYSSLLGIIPFVVFLLLFLSLEQNLLLQIQDAMPIGGYINAFTSTLYVFVEGIVVSLIGSYIIVRIVDDRMPQAEYPDPVED